MSNNINEKWILAIGKEQWEKAMKYLRQGALINYHSKIGSYTALHHVRILTLEQIQKLCEQGANVNALDHNDMTPLHQLTSKWNGDETEGIDLTDMAKIALLIDGGADVTLKDCTLMTPMDYLSGDNYTKVKAMADKHQLATALPASVTGMKTGIINQPKAKL